MILYSSTFLLLSNAVSLRRDKSILYARIAISILVCCLLLCLSSSYLRFIDNGVGLFGGLYHITSINTSFHIFIFLVTAFILQLNGFYPRKVSVNEIFTKATINSMYNKFTYFNTFILNKFSQQFKIIEYPLIIIFVIIGAVFLMSSCDLVSLFLSIELQSYGLYILCALYRNSERSVSAGLTYFLLGGLSSCFILLGFSLLYSNSGNTSFDGLYIINSISNATLENNKLIFSWYESYYLNISLMIISIGFLFKISAAPFHFWSPDVYDAIPTIVTTFVAIIAKISIFIVLLELVHFTKNIFLVSPAFTENNISWTITLLISSLLSLIIGSVLGLTQFRIKRLFAYSTISHVGFILLALSINTIESIQSFIFYLMQYSVTNLNAFLLLIMLGFVLYCYVEKKDIEKNAKPEKETNKELVLDKNNSPIQLISQLQGYFHINSYLAVSLAITIFSFVGVPPLMGFFAKQMILSSALDNGYVFMAFVAILTSVIGAYYYLAIIKQMFFHNTNYVMNPSLENITINGVIKDNNKLKNTTIFTIDNISLSSGLTVSVSLLTLTILLFILIPDEWLNMANILALILFKV